jgi:hypothetical protein
MIHLPASVRVFADDFVILSRGCAAGGGAADVSGESFTKDDDLPDLGTVRLDFKIRFLDLDPHTAARERQQLLAQDVGVSRARKAGGGTEAGEKKTPETTDAIEIIGTSWIASRVPTDVHFRRVALENPSALPSRVGRVAGPAIARSLYKVVTA